MQVPLPGPPHHVPIGLAPFIGYVATREAEPLRDLPPVDPSWWEEDEYGEEWHTGHPRAVKVTAVVVSASLILAGLGSILEVVLTAR